jgi:hypothetical protein
MRLQIMGHEQAEFADFYLTSRDPCLRAVTTVIGDRELAEIFSRKPSPERGLPGERCASMRLLGGGWFAPR